MSQSSATTVCVVQAPAKVNLSLEVLGKRPDGYHELETLMVALSLCDTLQFEARTDSQVTLTTLSAGLPSQTTAPEEIVPAGSTNLVVRAAERLRHEAGSSCGVHITLWKRIPLAAGLGGGSSDAAAVLKALNAFWQLGFSRQRLLKLAAELGSDVPFFLADSVAAVCRGRGELLTPVSLPGPLHFVIVKPDAGLSTAAVFQRCRPAEQPVRVDPLVHALQEAGTAVAARFLHNRLLEPAVALCPSVRQLQTEFGQFPLLGHTLSGSGTSYLGWCRNRDQARTIAARLRARGYRRVYVVQSTA